MKKAILITGIIWIVLALAVSIFEIVYGANLFNTVKTGDVEWEANVALGVANIIVGCWFAIAIVFAIILILKRNSNMGKGAGIALGVIAAVLGAVAPGVLFVIDSAMNRE